MHTGIYNENLKVGFEINRQEAELKAAEKELQAYKQMIKNQIAAKEKQDMIEKEQKRKQEEAEYMKYQEELRHMTIDFIKENIKKGRLFKYRINRL